jgi:hypothetical protein
MMQELVCASMCFLQPSRSSCQYAQHLAATSTPGQVLQLQAFFFLSSLSSLLLCACAGLWPDVGFAFKAAHMPCQLGLFLGLSGVRLSSAADLLYTGIATHYVPEHQLQVGEVHSSLAGNVLAMDSSACRNSGAAVRYLNAGLFISVFFDLPASDCTLPCQHHA